MAAAAEATGAPQTMPMTRREFLYYVWAASIALFAAQTGGALLWFMYPRFKEGTFGGTFTIDLAELPEPDTGPKPFSGGRFWLVNMGDGNVTDERQPKDYPQVKGVKALYMVCVHLGCLYAWVPVNNRFECPCHGSKYLASGTRVDGPAARNLDVFYLEAQDDQGTVLAQTEEAEPLQEGKAVDITGATKLVINTGKRIVGGVNTKPGGGK